MTFDAIKQAGFEVHVLFIPREYEWSELFNPDLYKDILNVADMTFFCHAPTPGPPAGDVYTLDEWWPSHSDDYCRWVFANNGYEIIFCNYIFMSRIFQFADRSAVKIVDTHDVFADRKKMLIDNDLKPEFFYTTLEDEREGVGRADVALAIKEQEAEYFRDISDVRVINLPYFEASPDRVTTGRAALIRPPTAGKRRFGFFGSSNSINVKNIVEFARFLAAHEPADGYAFELWLYGSLCKRMPANLPAFVRIGGYVDTVDEFYDGVDCVVNPQYFSTGLKIKVAEALAYHAPLICHRHSFEGFGEPVHPAQDCASFEAVLRAMERASAEPAFLEEVREATITVQARLADECNRQMAKVLGASARQSRWLWVFVNGGVFDASRLYRHLVESFFWAFSRSHFITFVDNGAPPAGGLWSQFRRRANRNAFGVAQEDLDAGARCVFFDDPAACLAGARARGGDIVFGDAVGLARGLEGAALGAWVEALGGGFEVVRCANLAAPAGVRGQGRLAVRYFRWLPWDMGLWTGADNHEVAPEVWLLSDAAVDPRWREAARAAFPDLRLRLFADGPGDAAGAAGEKATPLAALTNTVFARRVAPTLVLRLSDDPGFDIFVEWCAANGVPVRDYVGHAHPGVARAGAAVFTRLSDFARPARPSSEAQSPVASWSASGWESLADLVHVAAARRARAA